MHCASYTCAEHVGPESARQCDNANSLAADPLFVDVDGADGVLGFVDAARDGRDDDFSFPEY